MGMTLYNCMQQIPMNRLKVCLFFVPKDWIINYFSASYKMLARGGVATLQLYLEILFFCIKIVTATSAWGLFNKVYFLFGNLEVYIIQFIYHLF